MAHLKKAASGHLLKNASGHLVKDCVPTSCPCDATEWAALVASGTPCHSLVDCYQIKSYTDGDIPACSTCENKANPIWDGTFHAIAARCYWVSKLNLASAIDGKTLNSATVNLTPVQIWSLTVYCYDGTPVAVAMWQGRKTVGGTPVGLYTRTDSDCAAGQPDTLEIEECP